MNWVAMGMLAIFFSGCGRQPDPPAPVSDNSVPESIQAAPEEDVPRQTARANPSMDSLQIAQPRVYDLLLDPADLERLESNPSSNDKVSAAFVADGTTYQGVEVRLRGAWSRGWPKKSLKLFFSRDQPFEDNHTLNFNSGWRDPAFIRETLAYYVYGACGALTLNSRMVRLNVKGQFRGLYVEVEQPEKAFLHRVQLKGAAIYKAISPSNRADERDHGAEESYAQHYSQETRKNKGSYADLRQFCYELARARHAREFFNRHVDLERYINYLAATVLTQNWDCFNKNHFLVYDGQGSQKWLVLPWDLDRTFGDLWNWSFQETRLPILLGTRQAPGITGWNRLEDRFFSDPELRARFLDRLTELIEQEFTPQKLFPILERFEAELADAAALDRRQWPSRTGEFHQGIGQVKKFIEQRRAYLLREIPKLRHPSRPPE